MNTIQKVNVPGIISGLFSGVFALCFLTPTGVFERAGLLGDFSRTSGVPFAFVFAFASGGDEGFLLELRTFAFALTGEGLSRGRGLGLGGELGIFSLIGCDADFTGELNRFTRILANGISDSESELNESTRFRLNPRFVKAGKGDPTSTEPSFEGDRIGVKFFANLDFNSGEESSDRTLSSSFPFPVPLSLPLLLLFVGVNGMPEFESGTGMGWDLPGGSLSAEGFGDTVRFFGGGNEGALLG